LTQELSSLNLFAISPTIRAESEQTHCCEQRLLVQKTVTRSVVSLSVGKIHIHETVKQCKGCKEIYAPEEPNQLVPQYCNFGFDVIVHVGEAFFQKHQSESDIAKALWQQNIFISESEVSYLAKKFICYFALAHKDKVPEIRQITSVISIF
jgi:hypothetical protein